VKDLIDQPIPAAGQHPKVQLSLRNGVDDLQKNNLFIFLKNIQDVSKTL
jgi:hypothetical protein